MCLVQSNRRWTLVQDSAESFQRWRNLRESSALLERNGKPASICLAFLTMECSHMATARQLSRTQCVPALEVWQVTVIDFQVLADPIGNGELFLSSVSLPILQPAGALPACLPLPPTNSLVDHTTPSLQADSPANLSSPKVAG